jgi:hypothetical protein
MSTGKTWLKAARQPPGVRVNLHVRHLDQLADVFQPEVFVFLQANLADARK